MQVIPPARSALDNIAPWVMADLIKNQRQKRNAERNLVDFIRLFWGVVEPGRQFVGNWHIDLIAEHLEAVSDGDIKDLLVNIPPGCAKSLIISVFFPSWEWVKDGTARFLGASYGEELAVRDSTKCRDIVMSEDYQKFWPHIRPKSGQDQKLKYTLETGGWRLATSVGGRATGEHPTFKLVDDPHSALQALSDAERGRANTWFTETLSSRGAALDAATIVVMQRLHQDDTSGVILEQLGGYTHLCLPMRYDPMHPHVSKDDPRKKKGQLLWPEMFTEDKVVLLERRLGEYGASGQLQQLPSPPGGGILKTEHLQMWPADRLLPPFQFILLSLDTAFTEKTANDPTACVALGVFTWKNRQCAMLLDCWTAHLGYPQLRERVIAEWGAQYGADKRDPQNKPRRADLLLIEEKGSGISLIQDLRGSGIGARKYNPGKMDKLARAHQFAPMLEMDVFYIPESKKAGGQFISWAEPLVAQLEKFPNATHDDLVDTVTQGFIYLRDAKLLELPYVDAVDDEHEVDYALQRAQQRNPYDM